MPTKITNKPVNPPNLSTLTQKIRSFEAFRVSNFFGARFPPSTPRKGLQQAVHRSSNELKKFLNSFIQTYNTDCGPYIWTKGPDKLRKIIDLTKSHQDETHSHCEDDALVSAEGHPCLLFGRDSPR